MKKRQFLGIFAAFLIVWMMLAFSHLALLAIKSHQALSINLGLLFFIANGLSAIGLIFLQRWAFWLAYPTIILSTLAFGVCYVPIAGDYLPMVDQMYGILLFNALFMLYLLCVNIYTWNK